jgi:hypothetical protein
MGRSLVGRGAPMRLDHAKQPREAGLVTTLHYIDDGRSSTKLIAGLPATERTCNSQTPLR